MKDVFRIKGAIQNYAWGGKEFIPKLMNMLNVDDQPFAEVWLGAHQRSSAKMNLDGKEVSLNFFLENNPQALGDRVINNFGNRLPYLFKVLDVKQMLSIQTHPTKKAAENGFYAEEKKGIPIKMIITNQR
jgi:mannose-6-phosphate isomerase